MPTIRVSEFHGLMPKVDRRRLPSGFSELAENVRFDTGDLQPIRGTLSGPILDPGVDIGNLHFHQDGEDIKYVAFGNNHDVYFARSPVPDDEHKRFYWCLRNDNVVDADQVGLFMVSDPIASPATVGTGADFRQFAAGRQVGIPAPGVAPVISDVTNLGKIAFEEVATVALTNPIQINTSVNQPFEDGDRVRIVINRGLRNDMVSEDGGEPPGDGEGGSGDTTGQAWALNGAVGVVRDSTASSIKIVGISAEGFSDFNATDLAAISVEREINDEELDARFYVFTYVSEYGEEGPPSPPSNIIDVFKEGAVRVQMTDSPHVFANTGGARDRVNRIRVYRGVAGTNSLPEIFVGELPFAASGSDGNLSWESGPAVAPENSWTGIAIDEVEYLEQGEILPSRDWYPPPPRMEGMHVMPNGFMVGWRGNALYFSEPYLPHAWPGAYKKTTDDDILGVQSYGNTLVIGTRGRPYIARGNDPASMSMSKVDFHAPLARPRAMVDAGSGVLFPSTHGLIWIGSGPTRNLTERHFDRKTWLEALDGLDRGVWFDNRAIFYSRTSAPMVVDVNGDSVEISYIGSGLTIGAAAPAGSDLLIVTPVSGLFRQIELFKRDGQVPMTARWRSGLITTQKPCNMAAAQVYADGYPVAIGIYHANLTTTGQPDLGTLSGGQLITVDGPEAFRLPADYLSREFQIEIMTPYRIQQVLVSTSMAEIRQLP